MTTLLAVLLTQTALAGELQFVHSAHITDASGAAPTAPHDVTVRLLAQGGTVVWEDTFEDVPVTSGYFSVTLATDESGRTLQSAMFGATPAVTVSTEASGPSGSVSLPSQPLTAVPESARTHGVQVLSTIAGTVCTGDGGLAFDSANGKLTVCTSGIWTPIH